VSGIGENHCPVYAGISVRNQQEPVSALRKNHCPEWSGIGVRFRQEYAIVSRFWKKWEEFDIENIDPIYNSDIELCDNFISDMEGWIENRKVK
jgi:hypothetical protein